MQLFKSFRQKPKFNKSDVKALSKAYMEFRKAYPNAPYQAFVVWLDGDQEESHGN